VATYHSRDAADKAQDEWTRRFSEKRLSETELPILPSQFDDLVTIVVKGFAAYGITKSRTEASRLVKQGSVQLDGAKLRTRPSKSTCRLIRSCASTRLTRCGLGKRIP